MQERAHPLAVARTAQLDIAYEAHGRPGGLPVILLHGFPYSPRCYDAVAPELARLGCRVIVPYLRGYGQTRFHSPQTMRSGQQAALAQDLLDLMDALALPQAALMGYDWGGRAACIVAALQPQRVKCLVTGQGYNIQDIAGFALPQPPVAEHRLWYQYYFHSPRGRAGLAAHRDEMTRLLWRLWSPSWHFGESELTQTVASFYNPDFVDVVVHSYRHRYGYVAGDPAYEHLEAQLARQPPIAVPAINLCGAEDGVGPPDAIDGHAARFTGPYERRLLPGVGHNYPQEAPQAAVAAMRQLLASA
jgi:pimeloyl-ACP methyl ester carboxylesterase